MQKKKRDEIVSEMRERLFANRDGRLLPSQWIDLAIQPLVTILILTMFAIPVFGRQIAGLFEEWLLVVVPLMLLLFFVPVVIRAFRYARAPIHFARFYGTNWSGEWWTFWRPIEFHTADEQPVRFVQRLAPRPFLARDREYLVYYLDDPRGKVLLSCAPADHEDADLWLPSKAFEARFAQRGGHL